MEVGGVDGNNVEVVGADAWWRRRRKTVVGDGEVSVPRRSGGEEMRTAELGGAVEERRGRGI